MQNSPLVSVVIPCYNEELYISDCITSLLLNDYKDIEIIVIDGVSTDKTEIIISDIINENPNVILEQNNKRLTPISLNIGVTSAKGEFIMIAGAHSKYPSNYISNLMKYFEDDNILLVGGSLKTEVKNRNSKSLAIKAVLSNKFGVGNSYFRTGVTEPKFVDAVPFGIYRKQVFTEMGTYNEKLIRNHDIELNKRIINNKGKILLDPKSECIYYSRETYNKLGKNNYSNGLWNILTVYITKNIKSLSLRHFIPLAFITSIVLPVVAAFAFKMPVFYFLSIISFLSYNLLIFTISLKIKTNEMSLLHIISAFYVLHFSYGMGSLVGLSKLNYLFK
ncbi:MAG: glycosyltransferase family 2 protein [Bacteroidales bacterium]|nr:glycosyltransferase family 2 protein [Bacteroidales bacterium]